ncbi:TPA: hypothetical protein I0F66_RS09990 [Enterococcus faecalis]|nr:hypothetical protein [Enterococcus faecalis]
MNKNEFMRIKREMESVFKCEVLFCSNGEEIAVDIFEQRICYDVSCYPHVLKTIYMDSENKLSDIELQVIFLAQKYLWRLVEEIISS